MHTCTLERVANTSCAAVLRRGVSGFRDDFATALADLILCRALRVLPIAQNISPTQPAP